MKIIDKEGLLNNIDIRIQLGEDLLIRVRNREEFDEDSWYHWHEENSLSIKQFFQPQENEISNKYLNSSPSARTFMDAASGKNNGTENEILDRLSKLKLVRKLVILYNEDKNINETIKKSKEYHPTKVFVIHGHDKGLREEVARVVVKLGLVPVILNEQVSKSQTIIEKFELNSDVGYAITILSPDDIGGVKNGESNPRARQNVIFEMGYFFAKIGRHRVFNLKKENVEQPSDLDGILYYEYQEGWEYKLAKELKELGYPVDLNNL